MARPRLKGTTDQSVTIYIVDDTDGTPEQGVVYNTGSIAVWYRREGEAKVALSLATLASASASHTDSGFIHIDDGVYRLDLPNAAFASGAGEVTVGGSIPDMVVLPVTIPLVDYNNQDAVRLGLTSLPNAVADAAGGLPISDAGGLDMDALATSLTTIDNEVGSNASALTTIDNEIAAIKTVVDNVETDTTSIETKVDLIDTFVDTEVAAIKTVVDDILEDTGTTIPATITTIDNEIAVIDGIVDDILVDTGTTLPATLATIDGIVEDILVDTGTTIPATIATIDSEIGVIDGIVDDILADTNELQSDDVPGLIAALDTVVDRVEADTQSIETKVDLIDTFVDTEIAAIKTVVDDILEDTGTTIPATITTIDTVVDSILVDTAEIGAAGAGLTALSTQASVDTIDGIVDTILLDTAELQTDDVPGLIAALSFASQASVDTIDGIVDAILVDTGTTLPATLSGLATSAEIAAIDTLIDTILADTAELQADWVDGGRLDLILDAATAPSAAAVADAIWDEATSGHVTAGSFGLALNDPPTRAELTSDIAGLNDLSASEVNAQVDAALITYGLDHLVFTSVTGTDVADNSIIAQLVSDSATADWDDYDNTTDSLEALQLLSGAVTASAIADAVWDEDLTTHVVASSGGKVLADAESDTSTLVDTRIPDTISLAAINAEVDTAIVTYGLDHLLAAAVTGTDVTDDSIFASLVSAEATADWDDYTNTTDSLDALGAGTGATPATIADAVWDEARAGHTTAGTFGNYLDVSVASVASAPAPNLLLSTTIATYTDDQNFTLTAGPPDDDVLNGHMCKVTDQSTAAQIGTARVSDWDGGGLDIDLETAPGFTLAAGDIIEIFASPDRISLVDVVTTNSDLISLASINAEMDTALSDYDGPTDTEMLAAFAALNNITSTEVGVEVQTVIESNHLDHFFAADYNPDSKPGVATALMNEMVESDGGVSRFTANAVELAPGGAGVDSLVIADTTIADATDPNALILTAGPPDDDICNGFSAIITDQSTAAQKAVIEITDWTGSSLTMVNSTAGFVPANGDGIKILAVPYLTITAINATVDTALTDYDGPTDTEMNAAIDALENVSQAQTYTQVITALEFYDPPTRNEMDNGLATLNDISVAQVNAEVATALATYDPPTRTELSTDTTTVTDAIAALNDISTAQVNTEVDTALSDYDGPTDTEMLAAFASLSDTSASAIADAVWDEAVVDHVGAGSFGLYANLLDDIEADTSATVVDTNELQTDWANAGRLDTILDSLATQATVNTIDGNVDSILVDTGTTIPGTLSGLNDLSAAQVNAEVDTALTDYDGPTDTEMLAAFAALNDVTTAQVNTEIDTALGDFFTSSAQLVDDIWDEPTAGHTTSNTYGDNLDGTISTISALSAQATRDAMKLAPSAGTPAAGSIDTLISTVDTVVDSILEDTGTTVPGLIAALNDLSLANIDARLDNYDAPTNTEMLAAFSALNDPTTAAIVDAVWDEATSGHVVAGSTGQALIDAEAGASGGDATAASQTTIINAVAALNDISTAQVNTEVDNAFATYDPPTQTEAAAAHAVTVAAIAALNDLSAAAVNAEVDTALSGYDAPTRAELTTDKNTIVAAIDALNDPTAAAISTAVWGETTRALTDKVNFGLSAAALSAIASSVAGGINNLTAAAIADAVWDEVASGHGTSGTTGALLTLLTTIDSEVGSVLADTNELQTDWTNAGRLDAILDLVATQASVDAIDTVVDAVLVDTGTTLPATLAALNDLDAAGVRTELATELARLDVAVSTRLATAGYTAPSNSDITTILADTNELQVLLDELVSGTTPNREFTTAALANASATGGDATLANQVTLLASLSGAAVNVISTVDAGTITIKQDDDYIGAHVVNLPVADVGGGLHTFMSAGGTTAIVMGVSDGDTQLFSVAITKGDLAYASDVLTIPIPIAGTDTATVTPSNDYHYDIKYTDGDGDHRPIDGSFCLLPRYAT